MYGNIHYWSILQLTLTWNNQPWFVDFVSLLQAVVVDYFHCFRRDHFRYSSKRRMPPPRISDYIRRHMCTFRKQTKMNVNRIIIDYINSLKFPKTQVAPWHAFSPSKSPINSNRLCSSRIVALSPCFDDDILDELKFAWRNSSIVVLSSINTYRIHVHRFAAIRCIIPRRTKCFEPVTVNCRLVGIVENWMWYLWIAKDEMHLNKNKYKCRRRDHKFISIAIGFRLIPTEKT